MKRKLLSAGFVLLLLLISFCLTVYFTESPLLLFSSIKKTSCGAIAIRDHVVPFQKFGSRLFTVPYLTASYNEVVYLTEYSGDEKHNEFVRELKKLLEENMAVDIFFLAHSNNYYKWVSELDGAQRKKIRMVYNTGCSGADQRDLWLSLGIKSYVGHRSNESISPVFYFYFLRRWCAGYELGEATAEANRNMESKLNRLGAPVDSTVLYESQASVFGYSDYKINE